MDHGIPTPGGRVVEVTRESISFAFALEKSLDTSEEFERILFIQQARARPGSDGRPGARRDALGRLRGAISTEECWSEEQAGRAIEGERGSGRCSDLRPSEEFLLSRPYRSWIVHCLSRIWIQLPRVSASPLQIRFAVEGPSLPEARDTDCREGRRRWASRSADRAVPATLRNRDRARTCSRSGDFRPAR